MKYLIEFVCWSLGVAVAVGLNVTLNRIGVPASTAFVLCSGAACGLAGYYGGHALAEEFA